MLGKEELAYKLIMREEYPSYKWFIKEGYTALGEGFKRELSFSRNHHFFGDVSHWFYRTIAGINVNPQGNDANLVELKPHFINDLSFVKTTLNLKGGKIGIEWNRINDSEISGKTRFDGNIKARFVAPKGYMVKQINNLFDENAFIKNKETEILLLKA